MQLKSLTTPLFLAVSLLISSNTIAQKNKALTLATYTYSTNDRKESLLALSTALTSLTGWDVRIKSYPSPEALVDDFITDSVDVAMINSSGYLLLERKENERIAPIVNLKIEEGQTNYAGCIVVSPSNNNVTFNKSSGKRLALVAASSTSGNLVPRIILSKNDIADADTFFSVYYAGTHKKVVEDVVNQNADLGGCSCEEVERYNNTQSKNKLTVLDRFDEIPVGPIVVNTTSLSEGQISSVRNALIKLHESHPTEFRKFCEGWTEFKSADSFQTIGKEHYNYFRSLLNTNESLWDALR